MEMMRRNVQTLRPPARMAVISLSAAKAAESNQDADQDAHWNGVSQGDRDGVEEDFDDAGQWRAVADHEFEDASEVAGEENEGKDGGADQRVGDHFSQDVASENADPHNSD